MNYFLYKLMPPRPTFPADMTPAEGILMREHVAYWAALMKQGRVLAFGPVADPKGSYGIGIIQLEDAEDAQALGARDPVIVANAGFGYEVHPMPRLVVAPSSA